MPPEPIWGKRAAKYKEYVIIADPHLGFELEDKIDPPIFSEHEISKIVSLASEGDSLIILGDLKHTILGMESIERKIIKKAIRELSENFSEVILIKGNHDGGIEGFGLPENFVVYDARGTLLGDTYLLHGHSWPSDEILEADYLVMGHTHPVVILRKGAKVRIPVWVILETNEDGEERIGKKKVAIMPAFNSNLPGSNIFREGFLDVLSKAKLFSKKLRAYSVDGIRIV